MVWKKLDRELVLASKSPRRREILTAMGLTFTPRDPDLEDEDAFLDIDSIEESIAKLAWAKADSLAEEHHSSLIIGCDTVVVIENRIIGKPKDMDEAREMITTLSGKMHIVYSGVAMLCAENGFAKRCVARTNVLFRTLPDWEIDEYLLHNEHGDKAGAYAIQGKAMSFVEKIDGCFYNVMGLPVNETVNICKAYIEFTKGLE